MTKRTLVVKLHICVLNTTSGTVKENIETNIIDEKTSEEAKTQNERTDDLRGVAGE